MQLTIDLPENLAASINANRDRMDRILEEGLRRVSGTPPAGYRDLADVIDTLSRLPSPREVLALTASPELQERLEMLLEKNRNEGLDEEDERFWADYEFTEHLVRKAKAAARKKIEE